MNVIQDGVVFVKGSLVCKQYLIFNDTKMNLRLYKKFEEKV